MNNILTKYNKFLSYNKNNLKMEEVFLEHLAKKIKTPVYCYSISQIKNNFWELKSSFKTCKPLICYAVKANFNKNIINVLSNLGAGADVVSVGELKQCVKNGIGKEKIVFSGVGKTIHELRYAIKSQIKQINVESVEELEDIIKICKSLKKELTLVLELILTLMLKHTKRFPLEDSRISLVYLKQRLCKFLKNTKTTNL